jgi:hypothetical protein
MKTLTKQEIERQDFVDNKIFELVQELLPEHAPLDWDIETISAIRDAIRVRVVEGKKLMTEQEFYPYVKI